jgi:hypothetical protein
MEWYESRGLGGLVHEWGVQWDISHAFAAGWGAIETHRYRVMSSPDDGDVECVGQHRVLVTLAPDTTTDSPWSVRPTYLHQSAMRPATWGDPGWETVIAYTSHDEALAACEAEARRLGWRG